MSKHVLAVVAGGMGNQIQMTAAVRTLRERLGWTADFFSTGLAGSRDVHKSFDPILPGRVYNGLTLPRTLARFDGAVLLGFGANGNPYAWRKRGATILNDPKHQIVGTDRSEVDISMNACRELGVAEEDLVWHGELNCNEARGEIGIDIVLSNGYWRGTKERPNNYWHVRGYPDYPLLVKELRACWPTLSICCIGMDDRESIEGVRDRTGIKLMDALALIKRARLLITTDTMAFHAAACFDTPTVALWTATSAVKSACPRFHATATLVGRDDLECRKDCYARRCRWMRCADWQCQQIPVADIMVAAVQRLDGTVRPAAAEDVPEDIWIPDEYAAFTEGG